MGMITAGGQRVPTAPCARILVEVTRTVKPPVRRASRDQSSEATEAQVTQAAWMAFPAWIGLSHGVGKDAQLLGLRSGAGASWKVITVCASGCSPLERLRRAYQREPRGSRSRERAVGALSWPDGAAELSRELPRAHRPAGPAPRALR